MANEFVVKNGLISQGNVTVSGSISTTSPVNLSGFATGSVLFTSGSEGAITGSSNLFWDNTNSRLGLNCIPTTDKLEIYGNIRFQNTLDYLKFANDLVAIKRSSNRMDLYAYSGWDFYDTLNSISRLRISTTGNVLINTTTDAGAKMTLRGSGATSATTALRVENTNASASLVVLDNGFVGIGKNTPISTLHLGNDTSGFLGDFTTPAITFNSLNNGIYLDANRINFKSGGGFSFGTDSNGILGNGFRINAALSNDLTTPIFVPTRISSGSTSGYGGNSAGNLSIITNNTPRLYVDFSGSVGIGTISPSASLHISGASSAALLEIDSPAVNNILYVSGSGRVGIGTSTPTATFDVSGSARLGNITFATSGTFETVTLGRATLTSNLGSANQFTLTTNSGTNTFINVGYGNLNLNTGILAAGNISLGGVRGRTLTFGGGEDYIGCADGTGGNYSTRISSWSNIEFGPTSGFPGSFVTRYTMTSTGFGIYVSSPTARLHVQGSGTTSATTAFLVQNANTSSSLAITDDGQINMIASGGRIKFINPSSGASGNGIFWGVSATGTTYGSITLSSGGGQLDYLTNTSYFHRFVTLGSTEVMRIGTGYTANIGIRTSSPQVGLHIATTTAISGSGSTLSVGTLISSSAVTVYKSGSTVLDIQGSQGQLFSVIDALSGSLMSVNDVSGLPILEVFSDDRVVMGTYGAPALIVTGSNTIISGSLRGRVVTLSTASATASMDCSLSNFFDLTLSGSMYLGVSNIQPGETINLRITQPATSGSLNYTSSIKFPNGLPYSASATSSVVDLISFISFDSSTLYATSLKNLI